VLVSHSKKSADGTEKERLVDIPYRQLDAKEALRVYADWLLSQKISDPFPFFRCEQRGEQKAEWYMITYPLRTLMLASDLLGDEAYREAAFTFLDTYCDEQLPNGGFTSNFRQRPTTELARQEFLEIVRTGKVNVADNGSNVLALVQGAMGATGERKDRYLNAARKWFDEWVYIWALPEGGYGNGIWQGHKLNAPYSCAISTVTAALSAFALATGETEYVKHAERAIAFHCEHWLPGGCPVNLNCYPLPSKSEMRDYGHSFYLLEGMCWTHFASKNEEVRATIEDRLTQWIFGERGILSQWVGSWFYFQWNPYPNEEGGLNESRLGLRPGWEFAKSNGILHALSYYRNHIKDDAKLREICELGTRYLAHPLKARMSGVVSDPDESYGMFAVQATGFAGLSLAEAIQTDAVFECVR
jgi:hypothetical protein